jgi:hypothetical protein
VVLLPGASQLQAKDIAWRLKASEADCLLVDAETAAKVWHIGFGSDDRVGCITLNVAIFFCLANFTFVVRFKII